MTRFSEHPNRDNLDRKANRIYKKKKLLEAEKQKLEETLRTVQEQEYHLRKSCKLELRKLILKNVSGSIGEEELQRRQDTAYDKLMDAIRQGIPADLQTAISPSDGNCNT